MIHNDSKSLKQSKSNLSSITPIYIPTSLPKTANYNFKLNNKFRKNKIINNE